MRLLNLFKDSGASLLPLEIGAEPPEHMWRIFNLPMQSGSTCFLLFQGGVLDFRLPTSSRVPIFTRGCRNTLTGAGDEMRFL
jgi:hypothetical protein